MPPLLSLLKITEKGDVTTAYSQSRERGQPNARDQLAKRTGPGQKGLTIPNGTRSPKICPDNNLVHQTEGHALLAPFRLHH